MKSSVVRPLAGLGLVVAFLLICALAVWLFRGYPAKGKSVPVTVISQRAGLVMNPDAKVKLRGVQVGKVDSIESLPDGQAALHLEMDPAQTHLIPGNVDVAIASSTVFGAKFVQLTSPEAPSPEKLRAGQVIQGKGVTVEINTVFQQLVHLLDHIDPAKLNQTLGAAATAFNGRGEQLGQTLSDFNTLLAKIEPSLPNLSHDLEVMVPALNAYGDAAPDLMSAVRSTTQVSKSIVEEQRNLDEFLVSSIGLADLGNEVIGGNRQALTDLAHYLVPTTDLLALYHDAIRCGIGGLAPLAFSPPQYQAIRTSSGLQIGIERYRYPRDLPKVAAKSGGANYCEVLGLPELPANFVSPFIAADVGSFPGQYGNQGILLNSEALKNWLFGPLDGPPRNTAQMGMPG